MVILLVAALCIGITLAALSLREKLRLNANANDHDGNITNSIDILYDLNNNYDTNGDGVVTEQEWIARWTCAFGDTPYLARFAFNQISQGKPEIRAADFTVEPYATGFSRDAFIKMDRGRYQLFEKDGCVNTDLTMDQKLDFILRDNNHNHDSVVDYSDVAHDLNTNYDTNKDHKVSQAEWVLRWCCAYGDTAAYARYVWNKFTQGADSMQVSQFDVPPFSTTGIPLDQFKAINRQRYEAYAANPIVGK